MDTKADRIPKILFSVLLLPLAVLLNELAVTSPSSAAKLTTFEESFSASLPFFEAMQECKSPLLLMPPWLMQRFFSAGWGGGERAVLQDFSDEHERGNFPMSPKNSVCDGRVRPEGETVFAKFGKGQRCHVWSSRGILVLM